MTAASSRAAGAPDRRIWLDGTLVPWREATVHVLSHSLQRGSLVFDYMSVHETPRGAAIFRLREHIERFLHSIALVGLPLARGAREVEAACAETVRANPGAKSLKISAYLPSIEVDVVPQDERVALAIAAYDPLEDVIRRNPGSYPVRATLSVWIEKERRQRRADILPPQAKVAANYTSPMAAKWAARRRGYDEVLLLDDEGCVAEGPTTNVFWVDAQGVLRTPPAAGVLPGITRLSVLELAKHDGLRAEETRVGPAELMAAPEVFLTGTTAGVWPVLALDGQPLGGGAVGPVTARLRARLQEVQKGADPAFLHWLTPVAGA
jgi:branched-chain amino acid aminotransferase